MNRKCGQNVATDDRRTFTDKDKVRRIQTLGNVILALVIALLDFVSKVIQIFVYEIRHTLARHEYLQGGQQQFFIIVFSFSMHYQTLYQTFLKTGSLYNAIQGI